MNSPIHPTKLSTGILGLDEMLHGGYLPGNANLIAGSPGTGKTTAALHFLAAGVAAGEKGVFVTFEYLPQQIYRDAEGRGWPLKQWEADGMVRVICTTPDVLLAETEPGKTILDEAVQEMGAKRLVIDSMTHFQFLGTPAHQLRDELAGLMNHLRIMDVTTVVTHEIPEIIGQAFRVSDFGLEFLSDAVILLRYVELEGRLDKAIAILKCRGSNHDRAFHRYDFDENGIKILDSFSGVENIARGAARRSVAERARELV